MLKKFWIISSLLFIFQLCYAEETNLYYGKGLCATPGYSCIKIKRNETWQTLWPDPIKRDLIQRINRTDHSLHAGAIIAVPNDLENVTLLDVAPFSPVINKTGQKLIIVDQNKLAWGAYDRNGQLVKWGPISSGKDYCSDVQRVCRTMTGIFYVFHKEGLQCESSVFPVGEGGANMPYCMFFYKGYALHGSDEVYGYRDSHGCVRLFTKDAKWLNLEFVELPSNKNNFLGTKVVIQKIQE